MNPVRNQLLALGSAAVLTVYAAGFARTRAAAERFAVADQRRAGASEVGDDSVAEARLELPQATTVPPAVATTPPASTPKPKPSRKAIAPVDTGASRVVAVVPPPDSMLPVATVTAPPPPPPPPVVTADSVAAAQKAHATLKDGVYTGWGTSRHGDIEATVEIRDGKIFSATISQCLTRYPCSRIEHIVPQVVARQSADVDYVSGATQSANAFYHAVLEALTKAK